MMEEWVVPATCPNCRVPIPLDMHRAIIEPSVYENRLRYLLLTHSHMFVEFDTDLQLALPSLLMSPSYLRTLAEACLRRARVLEALGAGSSNANAIESDITGRHGAHR